MIEAAPEVVAWITYNKLRAHLGVLSPRKPPRRTGIAGKRVRSVQLPVIQA
jgi:hypothetical protein